MENQEMVVEKLWKNILQSLWEPCFSFSLLAVLLTLTGVPSHLSNLRHSTLFLIDPDSASLFPVFNAPAGKKWAFFLTDRNGKINLQKNIKTSPEYVSFHLTATPVRIIFSVWSLEQISDDFDGFRF